MNTPRLEEPFHGGKPRLYRRRVVVLAALVVAVSVSGIWWSLREAPSALKADSQTVVPAQRPFTFTPHASPRPVAEVAFENGIGQKVSLSDFRGKVVLLNIWATWCAPCRAEMPTLDRLQSQLGNNDFEVVALSIDRGGQVVAKTFFEATQLPALAIYVDATAAAQSKLDIIGVPTTLLIDREGREVARYTGPAEWDRPEIIATIRRYLRPRDA